MSYLKCGLLSVAFIGAIIISYYIVVEKTKEGFTSFARCRTKGFSKEFCLQTPVTYWGPSSCICPNGSKGVIHPGLRGECLCSRWY